MKQKIICDDCGFEEVVKNYRKALSVIADHQKESGCRAWTTQGLKML